MQTLSIRAQTGAHCEVLAGWVYAFGMYQPRWRMERHVNSEWSQAVILAKKRSDRAVDLFGRIIGRHLDSVLIDEAEYLLTHVPAEDGNELFLFEEFGWPATEMLAHFIGRHLEHRCNVLMASVLAQIAPKRRKQHQCTTDAERAENVRDIYAVTRSSLVAGRCVILVDDVLTSGATLRECANVLRAAGARSVMGVALARTERNKPPQLATIPEPWPGGEAA